LTEAELHVLVMLIQERPACTSLVTMAIRAALELVQQRGYVITAPKPIV
jgi:hypothetical protein